MEYEEKKKELLNNFLLLLKYNIDEKKVREDIQKIMNEILNK